MRIGLVELIVIVIVAIALIKPEKLRGIASNVGKAMKIIKEENAKLNEEHGIADNRKLLRKSEKGELGEGTTVTQNEDGTIHIVIE